MRLKQGRVVSSAVITMSSVRRQQQNESIKWMKIAMDRSSVATSFSVGAPASSSCSIRQHSPPVQWQVHYS